MREPRALAGAWKRAVAFNVKGIMSAPQESYDDAMFAFSRGDYDVAIAKLRGLLAEDPRNFDAQLSLGMAHYRKGDYATAIAEGHKAEQLRPDDQLVHTNLSLFYMKAGDKQAAERHGLQARVASWKGNMAPPGPGASGDSELQLVRPKPPAPPQFPDMPWKKQARAGGSGAA
jgi:predicted Zn-dependent protease